MKFIQLQLIPAFYSWCAPIGSVPVPVIEGLLFVWGQSCVTSFLPALQRLEKDLRYMYKNVIELAAVRLIKLQLTPVNELVMGISAIVFVLCLPVLIYLQRREKYLIEWTLNSADSSFRL